MFHTVNRRTVISASETVMQKEKEKEEVSTRKRDTEHFKKCEWLIMDTLQSLNLGHIADSPLTREALAYFDSTKERRWDFICYYYKEKGMTPEYVFRCYKEHHTTNIIEITRLHHSRRRSYKTKLVKTSK